jgi:hypothetical protein
MSFVFLSNTTIYQSTRSHFTVHNWVHWSISLLVYWSIGLLVLTHNRMHYFKIKDRSSIVAFVSVAAGSCLRSRCPEKAEGLTTGDTFLLLLRSYLLRALRSNGRCLQNHYLATGLYTTIINIWDALRVFRNIMSTIFFIHLTKTWLYFIFV